jgi:hypothetical protein
MALFHGIKSEVKKTILRSHQRRPRVFFHRSHHAMSIKAFRKSMDNTDPGKKSNPSRPSIPMVEGRP